MYTIPQTRGSTIKPGQAGAEACAARPAPTHARSGHGRPLAAGAAGALSRLSRPASDCRYHQGSIRQREESRRAPHIGSSGGYPRLPRPEELGGRPEARDAVRDHDGDHAGARGSQERRLPSGSRPQPAHAAPRPGARGDAHRPADVSGCVHCALQAACRRRRRCRRRLRPAMLGARARLRLAALCCFVGTACMLLLNSLWCRSAPTRCLQPCAAPRPLAWSPAPRRWLTSKRCAALAAGDGLGGSVGMHAGSAAVACWSQCWQCCCTCAAASGRACSGRRRTAQMHTQRRTRARACTAHTPSQVLSETASPVQGKQYDYILVRGRSLGSWLAVPGWCVSCRHLAAAAGLRQRSRCCWAHPKPKPPCVHTLRAGGWRHRGLRAGQPPDGGPRRQAGAGAGGGAGQHEPRRAGPRGHHPPLPQVRRRAETRSLWGGRRRGSCALLTARRAAAGRAADAPPPAPRAAPHPSPSLRLPLPPPPSAFPCLHPPRAARWIGTCSRSCSRSWRSARCTWCVPWRRLRVRAGALPGARVRRQLCGGGAGMQRAALQRATLCHHPDLPCALTRPGPPPALRHAPGARPPAGRLLLHQRHALPPRRRRRLRRLGRARLGLRRPAALVRQGREQRRLWWAGLIVRFTGGVAGLRAELCHRCAVPPPPPPPLLLLLPPPPPLAAPPPLPPAPPQPQRRLAHPTPPAATASRLQVPRQGRPAGGGEPALHQRQAARRLL